MTELTLETLEKILSGDTEEVGVHLQLIDRDLEIEEQEVRVHCHCLTLDGNGKISPARMVEYMRDSLADYAIPRSKMAQAKERDQKQNSTRAVMGLFHHARATVRRQIIWDT